jgi:hypothetical protein
MELAGEAAPEGQPGHGARRGAGAVFQRRGDADLGRAGGRPGERQRGEEGDQGSHPTLMEAGWGSRA